MISDIFFLYSVFLRTQCIYSQQVNAKHSLHIEVKKRLLNKHFNMQSLLTKHSQYYKE